MLSQRSQVLTEVTYGRFWKVMKYIIKRPEKVETFFT